MSGECRSPGGPPGSLPALWHLSFFWTHDSWFVSRARVSGPTPGLCSSSEFPGLFACVMGTAGVRACVRAVWRGWCARTCSCPCHQGRLWWGTPDLFPRQHRSQGAGGTVTRCRGWGSAGRCPPGGPGWAPCPLGASVPKGLLSLQIPVFQGDGMSSASRSRLPPLGGWAGGGERSQRESLWALWSGAAAGR